MGCGASTAPPERERMSREDAMHQQPATAPPAHAVGNHATAPAADPASVGTVRIRVAGPLDAELVDAMVREIARHEGTLDSVVAEPEDWRRLLAREDVAVLIATDGVEALGYASTTRRINLWLARDVLALDDLYVRDTARNRGVGRELMVAVARLAAPDGLTVVWGARLDNVGAHRFYRRLGARLQDKTVAAWTPDAYAWACG
jgi:GNAT superfamily N-acetyltransferase